MSTQSPAAQPSRANLIAAFNRTLAASGACQSTDLHVRKLLCYVFAKDNDGQGIQRSHQQLADRLLLPVPTLRRVIHRATKHLGLLTVTRQRKLDGTKTINRYSINWPALSDHPPREQLTRVTTSNSDLKSLALSLSPTSALSDHPPRAQRKLQTTSNSDLQSLAFSLKPHATGALSDHPPRAQRKRTARAARTLKSLALCITHRIL